MFLGLSLSLTEKSLEYDKLLRDCNHISRKDIDSHKDRMNKLALEIQEIRKKIALLTSIK